MKRQHFLHLNASILRQSVVPALRKLDPRALWHNPVIFVVGLVSVMAVFVTIFELIAGHPRSHLFFNIEISISLWGTLLFANFAEAVAEGRGKAQAESLKRARREILALRILQDGRREKVSSSSLECDDVVEVVAGEVIPTDGTVIEGIAAIDESAITGESAPVIREATSDRSAVTGGTIVLSDFIRLRVTARPGETFLDRMIALVEGANRQKTPNEFALSILLTALTFIFLLAVITLVPIAGYYDISMQPMVLLALFVCLIPTTIGGLLSAIGIAGMDRLVQRNVVALSGRAVEASGDISVLLLDKTGTITLGNRMASEFIAAPGVSLEELSRAALLASFFDETPEGRSIVKLARDLGVQAAPSADSKPIAFSAQTRMSGLDSSHERLRKGAMDAIEQWLHALGGNLPDSLKKQVEWIARQGGTPLVVTVNHIPLGVILLKDIIKPGISERFIRIRALGIRTVMITGDNKLTAGAIAKEAGVDDFLAEANPEDKLKLIQSLQAEGHLVAMTGDGTNDAPALAQSDVGLVMNTGTQAAREAGNMIDLDSDPTKIIEIVEIGKQLLMTRGSLTTFSVANDVAKYFAILPALFAKKFPALAEINIMRLSSPESAVLSAVIFNALIIVGLIPLALRGVHYKPQSTKSLLIKNVCFYGFGGLLVPFVFIKVIDVLVMALGLTS
jgi:K+-transporting ATPase ATPase B chain